MAMRITPDWLRNKIETQSETEVEAGVPATTLANLNYFIQERTYIESNEVESKSVIRRKALQQKGEK